MVAAAAAVTVATKVAATAVVSGRKRAVAATDGVAAIVADEKEERRRGERKRRKEEEKGIIDANGTPFRVDAALSGNPRWTKSTKPACWRRRRPLDARSPSSGDCGRHVELQGPFNSKFDQLNLAKSVDEISLDDLLEGNFTRPSNSILERAKKTSNSNEGVLHSIRKAASVLRKAPAKEENHLFSSSFFTQDFPDCPPKVILKKLGLSSNHDLDDVCPQMPMLKCSHNGLPPFPWSFPPTVDSGKSTTNRSFCQSKWVRIGSDSCLIAGEGFSFSDLDLKIKEGANWQSRETGGASSSSSLPLKDCSGCYSPNAIAAAEILCGMVDSKTGEEKKRSMMMGHGGGGGKSVPPLFRCSVPKDGGSTAAFGFRGKNWGR